MNLVVLLPPQLLVSSEYFSHWSTQGWDWHKSLLLHSPQICPHHVNLLSLAASIPLNFQSFLFLIYIYILNRRNGWCFKSYYSDQFILCFHEKKLFLPFFCLRIFMCSSLSLKSPIFLLFWTRILEKCRGRKCSREGTKNVCWDLLLSVVVKRHLAWDNGHPQHLRADRRPDFTWAKLSNTYTMLGKYTHSLAIEMLRVII